MKYAIPAILFSLLMAVGCQEQQGSKPMTDSAALDVTPAATPVAYSAPAPVQTMAPDPGIVTIDAGGWSGFGEYVYDSERRYAVENRDGEIWGWEEVA